MESASDVTLLFEKYYAGNREALDEIFPLVYAELRRLAASRLRDERHDHTLQPTALVHEAYMRLVEQNSQTWKTRVQFFGLAAEMMRRILVNHAVARNAQKREGLQTRILLDDLVEFSGRRDINLIVLNDALADLEKFDPRQAKIIELKFFTGLSNEETADVLEISASTVKREWRIAQAWLYRQLNPGEKDNI